MKTRFAVVTTTAALGLMFTRDAHAAGFALDVLSGRGTGMAGALTAATDASDSIFYNPAGIARGKTLDAQLGVTLIAPTFAYKSPTGVESKMPFAVVPPPHLYVSGGITDNLSVGVGLFTPYGLRINWGDDWAGRGIITEAALATYYVNPTVAYRIGPVRFGAGFQLVRATVELKRRLNTGGGEVDIDLAGDAWGAGGNAGVQVDAIQKYLTIGASYRSAVKVTFDGKADFQNVPRELSGTLRDQSVEAPFTMPDQIALGLSSRPIEKLLVSADVIWFGWGKFRSVDLNFQDPAVSSSLPKNWDNGLNYHLGAEGIINDNWRVRGGVIYDPKPSPANTLTPDIPDANRLNLAVGGTYVHETGFRADLGYQFIFLMKSESTAPQFPGEYGGNVNLLGISLGYSPPVQKVASNGVPPQDLAPAIEPPPTEAPAPAAAPANGAPASPPPASPPPAPPPAQ